MVAGETDGCVVVGVGDDKSGGWPKTIDLGG